MKVRDAQRAAVYEAERVLADHELTTYETAARVTRRIETILRSSWVRSRFLVHTHTVQLRTPERSARASYNGGGTFTLPPWAWRDSIILHEVAHLLANRRAEDFAKVNTTYSWTVRTNLAPQAAHGWPFCLTLLELVERFMGTAAASDLRRSFALHRVRCSYPTSQRAATQDPSSSRIASRS